MSKTVNLVKLSVGTQSVGNLIGWHKAQAHKYEDRLPRHVTRMWPKREAEILNGGSIFWVIKGVILCRQKVLRLDEVTGQDGLRRCAIVLDPELVRTAPTPKRAFQGWRYLPVDESPPDLTRGRADEETLPPTLNAALAEIGVL